MSLRGRAHSFLRHATVQDINTSLYFITVDRKNRAMRRLGQRVPRYSKVLQVRMYSTTLIPGPSALSCVPSV